MPRRGCYRPNIYFQNFITFCVGRKTEINAKCYNFYGGYKTVWVCNRPVATRHIFSYSICLGEAIFRCKKYHQNFITFCVDRKSELDAKCYHFYKIHNCHNIRLLRVKINLFALTYRTGALSATSS